MDTTTPLVTGVDFVVVPTRDFDVAVEFYGTVLGLPCSARYGKHPGAEFETGTLTLAVIATEEFGMGFDVNRNAIALRVEDYEAARAELESRGVTFTSDTIESGVCHMASFEDSDGNRLMIHHRYAPRTPLA
jgi:predicted enzyme related to lactoylglutathione lyase